MDTETRLKIATPLEAMPTAAADTGHRQRRRPDARIDTLGLSDGDVRSASTGRFDKDAMLQVAIGRAVRDHRRRYELNGVDLAKAAGISLGMLSRIENGTVSPSLATLNALASSLGISMTDLLCGYREQREAVFFPAASGEADPFQGASSFGLKWDCQTTDISFVHLTEPSERLPMPQHQGLRFLYALEGELIYRHGPHRFRMACGDSLLCDAALPQEIERLGATPARAISLVSFR